MKPHIQVFRVWNQYLPQATRKMTCTLHEGFGARVVSLIPDEKNATFVGIEMEGSYSFMINQWKEKFCV